MKAFKIFALVLCAGLLSSCQDVIDLDIPDTVNGIAISGRVTNSLPTYVTVSLTTGYFAQGNTPRIEDALVILLEDGDTASILAPDSVPGLYSTPFSGTVGRSYEIIVDINNNPKFRNSTWRSRPEELKRVFDIDSITIKLLNRNTTPQSFEEGFFALVYFQEPPGIGDNYRIQIWENDSLYDQDILVFDDANFDGFYIGEEGGIPAFTYYGPFDEAKTDSAGIEVSSLSRDYYEYLTLVNEQVFQVGSTFDPPPQTIVGNIYNANNPDELGFGYFGASAIDTGGRAFKP